MEEKFGSNILIIQGTSSHAGKSILVTALCRIFVNAGIKVAPFKAQNMSLNSWVTRDGKEIGIAQAIQAKGARLEPSVEMNPILLKPKGDTTSQIVLMGEPFRDVEAGEYYARSRELSNVVEEAIRTLSWENELIIVEGAGSPAEINLYEQDIANTFVSRSTRAPIILVADIERGGVFASIYGTIKLLPDDIQRQVKGIVINKFRGDRRILEPGIDEIEEMLGVPVLGVLPYIDMNIPSEDSVSIQDKRPGEGVEIAIIRLPRISNFTDFEPLEMEANVRYVSFSKKLGNPDAIIIPGTKNTIKDFTELKESDLFDEIIKERGKIPIIGICGGYQMLGKKIIDEGLEGGDNVEMDGLGLLDVETKFESYRKRTVQVEKTVHGKGPILGKMDGEKIWGYEIHMGETRSKNPIFGEDGSVDDTGLIFGTYLHGIFENENFKDAFLDYLCERRGLERRRIEEGDQFELLASIVERNIDMDEVRRIIGFN